MYLEKEKKMKRNKLTAKMARKMHDEDLVSQFKGDALMAMCLRNEGDSKGSKNRNDNLNVLEAEICRRLFDAEKERKEALYFRVSGEKARKLLDFLKCFSVGYPYEDNYVDFYVLGTREELTKLQKQLTKAGLPSGQGSTLVRERKDNLRIIHFVPVW